VRNRTSGIVGRGILRSDYTYDVSKREFRHVRTVNWTHKGEWQADPVIPAKTLADITDYTGIRRSLESQIAGTPDPEDLPDTAAGSFPAYTKDDFLSEVFLDEAEYARLRDLLTVKKNVILTGAPGVGKTFTAERLAYSIIGEKNPDLVRTVRFHPGYRYEDFVMDRPLQAGAAQSSGVFYNFCREAESDDRSCFFIIDDMDRGDIGRIFGELLPLIENTRRGSTIHLSCRDEEFSIPGNVYLIGTMTSPESAGISADRSFRRRFSFFPLEPAFDSAGFREILNGTADGKLDALVRTVITLNREIAAEPSLGESFRIGHSYFLNAGSDIRADALVEYELLPLIASYRQADPAKIKAWTTKLRTAVK
jgi:5-methylcytosine-specific restriction protein B